MAKQKGIFISVLFSLLIFQSLWNIAAAFCVHENAEAALSGQFSAHHFGHHEKSNTCIEDDFKPSDKNKTFFTADDHHDHLPSYTQLILSESHEAFFPPMNVDVIRAFKIDWSNLYQSPDLGLNSPPPMLSPLLAG